MFAFWNIMFTKVVMSQVVQVVVLDVHSLHLMNVKVIMCTNMESGLYIIAV